MKVLILGIDGMIGHKIAHSLSQDFELYGSSRKDIDIKDLKIPNGKIVYIHLFLISYHLTLLYLVHMVLL